MPLIKVQTSIDVPNSADVETLLKSLSASLAKHTGKPEAYVMTAFEPNTPMSFGGTFAPSCYIEIKSVGTMTPGQTTAMSQEFCDTIAARLGVPSDRTYIEFNDAKGSMWGWNRTTF